MGQCKDCKHWKAHTIYNSYTIHLCDAADHVGITEDVVEDDFAVFAEVARDGLWV